MEKRHIVCTSRSYGPEVSSFIETIGAHQFWNDSFNPFTSKTYEPKLMVTDSTRKISKWKHEIPNNKHSITFNLNSSTIEVL